MNREFTSILASLSTKGEGRVFLFGKEIFFFADDDKDVWKIATKVTDKKPSELREFFSYPFSKHSSLAIKDFAGRGVYFFYEVPPMNRYVFFQRVLSAYVDEAENWSKIFE
jgi:hypothetical protein